ncbi:MAG: BREX-3 system P-loop-containing protein BrxF [Chloroflexi bacterium]|nr:BREX-3 system P-loop-containing protein BrxF [Chloroflexota bacterium]
MGASDRNDILHTIDALKELYYRLLLLIGIARGTKMELLQELSDEIDAPIININLELSRRMLELTERQRALQAQQLMREILAEVPGEVVILGRIEILFAPQLELDPLKLLQDLSRNRMIVAAWGGSVKGNHLIYAEPGHAEFWRYPMHDLQIIDLHQSR